MYEQLLSNYCQKNKIEDVKRVLTTYVNIDLRYDDGLCFKFAFAYNSVEMLRLLFDYYREHTLGCDVESMEYKRAYADLRKILDEALEQYTISDNVRRVLKPYIGFDEEDVDNYDECDSQSSDHYVGSSEKSFDLPGKSASYWDDTEL